MMRILSVRIVKTVTVPPIADFLKEIILMQEDGIFNLTHLQHNQCILSDIQLDILIT